MEVSASVRASASGKLKTFPVHLARFAFLAGEA
jgi:hypothetical protein